MKNPWTKAETLSEGITLSGVLFPKINDYIPYGMELESIYCMKGLLELRYQDADNILILRKSNTARDLLSGDYNVYPDVYDETCGDITVHCRGSNDLVNVAEFNAFSCGCSICFNSGKNGQGMNKKQLHQLVEGMTQLP